ncbi:MmoB/DmpM family protein [Monashia sp. NPDC004114]
MTETSTPTSTGTPAVPPTTPATRRQVGVDIQESEANRAVVEAIEADNPDCAVQHLPGLVRITAPGRLVVNRTTVEGRLGRDWETHEFQMAIVSYFGHIKDWDDDEIVIAWDH